MGLRGPGNIEVVKVACTFEIFNQTGLLSMIMMDADISGSSRTGVEV